MEVMTGSRPSQPSAPDWEDRPCPELGVDVFYRVDGESAREWAHREAAAVRVCSGCPVQNWCLAEALQLRDVDGVRGGLTGDQRAELLTVIDVVGAGAAAA
jgi:WhiB family redox-sensing transcriptional regulator